MTPASNGSWIGDGYVEHVPPAVWNYEVSGKQVLPGVVQLSTERPRASRDG